jgi:hypothetical protein
VCVDITRDVMRMKAEGKTLKEMRSQIDLTYMRFGRPTPTPLPPA